MRIPSGSTDRYIYFVAVDDTDLKTRETGLSSFTVYRSRNGAAAAAMTTPTVNEVDSTNMPGVYELLLDEDTSLTAGNDTEQVVFHVTHTGMAPVTIAVELYRPETTEGNTLDVSSTGEAGLNFDNIKQATGATTLTNITVPTVTNLAGHTAQTGDSYARLGAPAGASVSADVASVKVDTGTTLDGKLNDIQGATFSTSTDSLESIRNRGDVAWTTGAGGESDSSLLQNTTIATLASQVSFTLTAGSADDDAYNGCLIVVTDQSTSTQKAVGVISDYIGSTKTVTLLNDPGIFTMAVGDTVDVIANRSLKSTVDNRTLDVTATGAAGIDWGNVENPSSPVDLAATDIQLCDTVTTNTDMRGTDSAALASICTEARLAELDAANLPTDVSAILADTNELQTDDVPGLIAALNDPTSAAIADAVLDELLSGHVTAGSLGKAIADILTDTAEIGTAGAGLTAVPWNAAWDAEVQSECADALVAINLDHLMAVAESSDVANDSALAKLVSKSVTAAWSDFANTTDSLQAQRDNVGTLGAALTDLGGMSTDMKAEVNTEVVDVLTVDTIAERTQGAPPVTPTLAAMISYLYMTWRNANTSTSTTRSVTNDAGTVIAKATMSDDGSTFNQGEMISGP